MTPAERERARVLVERAKAGKGRRDLALVVEYMREPGPPPDRAPGSIPENSS